MLGEGQEGQGAWSGVGAIRCWSVPSGVTVTFNNPQAQSQGQPDKQRRRVVLAMVVMDEGVVCSPSMMSVLSPPPPPPPPQVWVRLLLYCQEWASIMENQLILEVIRISASMVFLLQPPLSIHVSPFRTLAMAPQKGMHLCPRFG